MEKSLCDNKKCPNYGKYNRWCNHSTLVIPEVKSINKVSQSRKEEEKIYKKVRAKYLKEHPFCEANLPGCKKVAVEIHHRKGKVGELLYDPKYFLAVDRNCHEIIEKNPATMKKIGLSESRLSKPNKRA